jgi:hypothetical protein
LYKPKSQGRRASDSQFCPSRLLGSFQRRYSFGFEEVAESVVNSDFAAGVVSFESRPVQKLRSTDFLTGRACIVRIKTATWKDRMIQNWVADP